MRTLEEIVGDARSGGKPDYDELRYAVCAMQSLLMLDSQALLKLAQAQEEGKRPVRAYSPDWQFEEWYRRMKTANSQSPKEWLGWDNDPDNPELQARRQQATRLYEKLMEDS